MKNTTPYYTRTAQVLHWLMAIIFIAAWLIGFYSGNFLSYETDGSFKAMSLPYTKILRPPLSFWS